MCLRYTSSRGTEAVPLYPVTYPTGKPGAGAAALNAGHLLREHNGQWVVEAANQVAADACQSWLNAYDDNAAARARAKARTKAEAQRRIETVAPLWRQSNLIARAVELAEIANERTRTEQEEAEATALKAVFSRIKALRTASDLIEADIDTMDAAAAYAYDPAGSLTWPE